jgi:hypothetical protein
MAARVYRPLTVIAFNENDIWRQRYELNKQLQDLKIEVALLSETRLKPNERFFIPNYHIYRTDCLPGRKGGTAIAVRNPHNHIDLYYMCDTYTWQRRSLFVRDKTSSCQRGCYIKDYTRKGLVAKYSGIESQRTWLQN